MRASDTAKPFLLAGVALAACAIPLAFVLGAEESAGAASAPTSPPARTVVATPAVAPTAPRDAVTTGPPPAPFSIESTRFYPPLSIQDAMALCRRASALLLEPQDEHAELRNEAARSMIVSARNYCEFLDNRHSALGSYEWLLLTTQKTIGEMPVEDEPLVGLTSRVENVLAIAFESSGGEGVWVFWFVVKDAKDKETKVDVHKWVNPDLPWTVMEYLPERTTIVEVGTRRGGRPQESRLRIYAGVTDDEEYGRQAIHQLKQAQDSLDEGKPRIAAMALGEAEKRMRRFKDERIDRPPPTRGRLFGRTRAARSGR